jgi:hypothetical protein
VLKSKIKNTMHFLNVGKIEFWLYIYIDIELYIYIYLAGLYALTSRKSTP